MEELKSLLRKEFGFDQTTIKKLNGYFNQNFEITQNNEKHILKTYPFEQELFDTLEAETKVLTYLNLKENNYFPRPIPSLNGNKIQVVSIAGNKTIVRLLSYLEGEFLADAAPKTELYHSLGQFLGKMDNQLKSHSDYVLKARVLDWDLQNLQLNKEFLEEIPHPSDRNLVKHFFLQFEEHVSPKLPSLRKQVIHCDANEWNVLVQNHQVSGIIDFGDLCYSQLINEVAIALTYVIYDKEDPLAWSIDFLKGYHQENPLLEEEIDLLYYLIGARLCISLSQSAHARNADPENSYASISEKSAWKLLRKWISISPLEATNCFRKAVNLPTPEATKPQMQLERRHQSISSILSVSYKSPIPMLGAAFQYMYDASGNSILDAYNNIPHVGHCHPKVVEAGQRQMATLNTNTRYLYDLLPTYAEKLLAKFPPSLSKVYFVNSGSAASDLAMRLAQAHTGSKNFMVMEHGYHGNTQIAMDISDYKFSNKKGLGQKPNILKVPIPDCYLGKYQEDDGSAGKKYAQDAISMMGDFHDKIGAFITEPIVGCGGQVPLAKGYLKELYPAIRKQGGICISDEVQTGFGRIGHHFWGYEAQEVVPDMVILGKPMGNGHPIGAVITTDEIAASFSQGVEFFSSFGGNPVSCAIGLSVLEVLEEEQLQQNALEVGTHYMDLFKDLQTRHSCIGDVRGSGLFLGVEIVQEGTKNPNTSLASLLKNELRNRNILISTDGPNDNVLKTKPPLCFNKANAETVVSTIENVLKEIQ